jgi:hypothetical protein
MDTKVCNKCKKEKPISEFYKNRTMRDGYTSQCKECIKLTYINNKDEILKHQRESYHKNKYKLRKIKAYRKSLIYHVYKQQAFFFYSNGEMKCKNCGIDNLDVLTINHIEHNGSEHRKTLKTKDIYRWLVLNNFPDGYDVLCHNCNWLHHLENID